MTRARKGESLLLTNIRQLLTLALPDAPPGPRRGENLSNLGIIEDAALLCSGGKIVAVGTTNDAVRDRWLKIHKSEIVEIDCRNKVVLPGFVDSHTHPVFAAPRLIDFEKRTQGASYEEIAEAGGGIRASIEGVRKSPRTTLTQNVLAALENMAGQGTTTIEAKSGYGLDAESELKSLEVIAAAARQFPGTVIPTLLAAHTVPPEFRDNPKEYVRIICEEIIPMAAEKHLAHFVDVFVEHGAFSMTEAEEIFTAAWQHSMGIRAHLCQLTPASIQALLHFQPASFDHMDCVQDEEISKLAETGTVATLLPAANYFLGLAKYAPARKLIDSGVAVALATDYNPGTAPTPSMPFVLSVACTHMKMSPAETIAAATINAAYALRWNDDKGSIEPGKDADLAIFDVRDYREIPYWFATNKCSAVVMQGTYRDFRHQQ